MTTLNERPQQKDPLIGTVFAGRYKIERRLGRGGMGLVYRANQTDANRKVVLKVLAPDWIGDPEALARFEREARGLSALQHPNIVAIHDYGSFDGRAYIVMEYVAGETLERFVKRKGQLTLADFVPIAAQVLKGLGEAHSRGIIHRDIKPANLMLCERQGRANYVKILDFGLAKLVSGSSDITKQNVLGTPTCLSPEQIKGEKLDQRVDVYAVGILFYYMLAGRVPFAADNDASILYKHVHEKPEPLRNHLPEGHQVPDGVIDLIERCLEKTPSKRPRDANEVVEGLIDQVPFSMFKLPRAEPRPPEQEEEDLDEPYQDQASGEVSAEPIPGPQDIQVGTFGRGLDAPSSVMSAPSGMMAAPSGPSGMMAAPSGPSGLVPATSNTSQSFAASAAQVAVGSQTGPMGPNPLGLGPTGMTGAHQAHLGMMPSSMTYPPGAFPQLDVQPERSRNGMVVLGVLTLVVVAVLGYYALTPRETTPEVGAAGQSDEAEEIARLKDTIARAEAAIERGRYNPASSLLDASYNDFARHPDLMEKVVSLKDQIEIGNLLNSGRTFEEARQRDEALKAYREILLRNPNHGEARARIAALSGAPSEAALGWLSAASSPVGGAVFVDDSGAPIGITPLEPQPLAAGPHVVTIRLDGYLPWKKSVTIESDKTFPINAELTPQSTGATGGTKIRKTTKSTKPSTTKSAPSTTSTSKPSTSKPATTTSSANSGGLMSVKKKKK
ncbi:MAG: protein kinase [Myxococcales bacterium]|nr:protein kinase [Myxococcales bacterium]